MGDGALRLSPPASEFWVEGEFFFLCVELAALSLLRLKGECMRVERVSLVLFFLSVSSLALDFSCLFAGDLSALSLPLLLLLQS